MDKTLSSELPGRGLDPDGFSDQALTETVKFNNKLDEDGVSEAVTKIDIGVCQRHGRVAIHTLDPTGDHTYVELGPDLVAAVIGKLVEAVIGVGYIAGAAAMLTQIAQREFLEASTPDESKPN